ncbi:AAA family ATPase [Streptomyces chartreusis]|uniref:AAA family ATPase n=1 Tax=Streptomyces chartreusis TaxID=1969 RepID=A0A7H8T4C8_STRCX|nr:AAA family ATPase [Streptomyces chartreusis]QKZ18365.1 AAA family ATPase [Streptomyces chartreusis]
MTSKQNPLSFLPGPAVDRTTFEGWNRWCETRNAFVPAPILKGEEYARLTNRQKRLHDLHRLATHSSLPIQATPMSERVAQAVLARVEDGAFSHKAGTRGGIMVNGDGAQGKTETVCEALAVFQEEWLALHNYANPDALPGTRDLVAPVAYVRCPVKATPISTCQRILDFYGEDYKGMRLEDLVRTVKTALVEHATKALVIDDITRLKLHREADQDVLDLIREMMSMPVTLILVGVGIPTSGLLREGRRDPKTQEWIYEPVKDRGRSPNDHAASQHERRFQVVDLGPFSYVTPAEMKAWMVHLRRLEGELRLLTNTAGMLTEGDMPEYLFNRTKGVVGILEKLIQHGCRRAMEDKSERLSKDLLNQFTVTPDDMPDLDADSGEQPDIPPHKPTPSKKPKGRNTVFDDVGPAAAGSAG